MEIPAEDREVMRRARVHLAAGRWTQITFPPVSPHDQFLIAQILHDCYGMSEHEILIETGISLDGWYEKNGNQDEGSQE